ncbi:methyltransferase [Actinomadura hibisca]|uniref:methyltransferase n=1 Tax=Actinomadura hibisca TaxID=68565 RepID=UPI000AA52AC9|nr:methyltransferase [Actinomadura hibisca]
MDDLVTPQGTFRLTRYPQDPRDRLRAWDAADEYALRHLAETDISGTTVIVGDRWGALTTALAAHTPTQITDSYLAQQATTRNLKTAGTTATTLLTTQDEPPTRIDTLLVRVPKSLALLEDQLRRLAPSLHENSTVLGTGMAKEIHTSTLRLFEEIIGPTRTSLAAKKARLIFSTPDPALPHPPSPWPLTYTLPPDAGPMAARPVTNHAGVFSADHLDIGTRFFLENLPTGDYGHIIDLGCGNGVVGTAAALLHPNADILFTDESFQAIASAKATFAANAPNKATFQAGDALTDVPPRSVDLILNNPPFHTHQAMGDATAWRMFTGARDALTKGGELWVVGNRHLGYHVKLRRIFGNCRTMASNPKFVILRAIRR